MVSRSVVGGIISGGREVCRGSETVRKRRVATRKVEVRAFRVVLVDVCWRSKIKWLWVCRTAARAGMRVVMFRIVIRAR